MVLLCALVRAASAQQPDAADASRLPKLQLAIVGVAAGGAGVLGGILLGHDLERALYFCECDDPGLTGAIAGAFIGPALLVPLAVHLANERRGKLMPSLATSLFIGASGLVFTFASGGTGIILVPVLPVFEIVTSIRHATKPDRSPSQER